MKTPQEIADEIIEKYVNGDGKGRILELNALHSVIAQAIEVEHEKITESELERVRLERALEKCPQILKDLAEVYIYSGRGNDHDCALELSGALEHFLVKEALANPKPNQVRDELRAAEKAIKAARDLDNVLAEFGPNPKAIGDTVQVMHDRIYEYDAVKGKAT